MDVCTAKKIGAEASSSSKLLASTCEEKGNKIDIKGESSNNSNSGNARKKCIFCDKYRIKRNCKVVAPIHLYDGKTSESMLFIASQLGDESMVQKIKNIISKNGLIFYHKNCSLNYENVFKLKIKEESKQTETLYESAFDDVCKFVSEKVIQNKQCVPLQILHSMFIQSLRKQIDPGIYAQPSYLHNRLLATFPTQITIVETNKRHIVKPYKKVLLQNVDLITLRKQDVLQQAAFILRSEINKFEHRKLQEHLTSSDLIKGESQVPSILMDFYMQVLSGTNYQDKANLKSKTLSKSFSEDLIYAVSDGNIKPSKHITLGMTLKSLTKNKNVVDIVNRHGHCCSYSTLEEMETESMFSASNTSKICTKNNRSSNLDRFVYTTNQKDNLDDANGITYQNIFEPITQVHECTTDNIVEEVTSENAEKRRTFTSIKTEESYSKKPKLEDTFQSLDYQSNFTTNSLQVKKLTLCKQEEQIGEDKVEIKTEASFRDSEDDRIDDENSCSFYVNKLFLCKSEKQTSEDKAEIKTEVIFRNSEEDRIDYENNCSLDAGYPDVD